MYDAILRGYCIVNGFLFAFIGILAVLFDTFVYLFIFYGLLK